jgi:hypothetical protein
MFQKQLLREVGHRLYGCLIWLASIRTIRLGSIVGVLARGIATNLVRHCFCLPDQLLTYATTISILS